MLPRWPPEMEKATAAPDETETPARQWQVMQTRLNCRRDGPGQVGVLCKGRGHAPQGAPGSPVPSKGAPAALGGSGCLCTDAAAQPGSPTGQGTRGHRDGRGHLQNQVEAVIPVSVRVRGADRGPDPQGVREIVDRAQGPRGKIDGQPVRRAFPLCNQRNQAGMSWRLRVRPQFCSVSRLDPDLGSRAQ